MSLSAWQAPWTDMQPLLLLQRWGCMVNQGHMLDRHTYARTGERNPVFDEWTRAMLQHRFNHALDEPIPEALTSLLATIPDCGER